MDHLTHPPTPGAPCDLTSRPLAEQCFHAFLRAMHAHRQLMFRKMSEAGIPPSQAFCLKEVAHNDGITQRDLAEALSISRPTLTVMLQKLEKAGLVERRADESDQRFTRIFLTAAGDTAHRTMHSAMAEVVAQTTGGLTDADQTELMRLLDALVGNTGTATATEIPAVTAEHADCAKENGR